MFRSEYLRQLRKEQGLKQADLAKAVGLSGAAIGSYERGVNTPPMSVVQRIADVLDVNAEEFWTDKQNQFKEISITTQGDFVRCIRALLDVGADANLNDHTLNIQCDLSDPKYDALFSVFETLFSLKGIKSNDNTNLDWNSVIDGFLSTSISSLGRKPFPRFQRETDQ